MRGTAWRLIFVQGSAHQQRLAPAIRSTAGVHATRVPATSGWGPHLQAAQLAGRCHSAQRIPERVVAAGGEGGGTGVLPAQHSRHHAPHLLPGMCSSCVPLPFQMPSQQPLHLDGSGMAASEAGSAMSPGCSLPCCAAAERHSYTENTCSSA